MALGPVSPGPLPPPDGAGGGTDPSPAPRTDPQPHTNSQGLPGGRPSRPGTLDRLLAWLVCGLAFVLASTPARNSDLWLHLASGRSLSAGGLPDGTDPFSSTTRGVIWV